MAGFQAGLTAQEASSSGKFTRKRIMPTYSATVLRGNGSEMLTEALQRRPWWRPTPENESFNLWWGGNGQPFDFSGTGLASGQGKLRQLVNKFAHHAEICTKSRLAVNLRRYAKAAGVDLTSVVPLTFVLKAGCKSEDRELQSFRAAAAECCACGEGPMWIVKPGSKNRGFGIEVMPTARAVELHLKRQKPGATWVVQKYLEHPLLLGGRKFDVRQYVLVTADLKVFMYKDSCESAGPRTLIDLVVSLTVDPTLESLVRKTSVPRAASTIAPTSPTDRFT